MDKRSFLKRSLASALALAGRGSHSPAQVVDAVAAEEEYKVWLWMTPRRRPAKDWREVFARLRDAGVHAMLPEVYNGREAFYAQPQTPIATRRDMLQEMIAPAQDAGIALHAWMWTMPCNVRQVVRDHPDWYVVNGRGEPAHTHPAYVPYYKFLCPRKTAVQDFVRGNVESLAGIDGLQGVHLDYVRLPDVILAKGLWKKYDIVQDREYPQYDYCYCEDCRQQFRQEAGIDPLKDLREPAANQAWRQFRYDGVTRLVNEHLVPAARTAGKQITAAVFPNWQSVRQEWHRWDLDGFLPMLYHTFYEESIPWVGAQLQAARLRLAHQKPIYAGLFLPSLIPADLKQAISVACQSGASGIALFEFNALSDDHVAAMGTVIR